MKMKQVCQLTGLTERTIRFYVEKELCAPETRWMDQRKYYDFSKENVEELRQAAELRKAYFSIQAIQTMRSSGFQRFSKPTARVWRRTRLIKGSC